MKFIRLTLILSGLLSANSAWATQVSTWPAGFWVQVRDEDGRAGDETLRFGNDGLVVVYGSKCQELPAGEFHLHKGNVYATFKAPRGLVSVVYAPSQRNQRLTFTSPRTGNNSVYAPAKGCTPVAG
jgi:hypothetical protein